MRRISERKGFTLIELAIVLVIIGLLAASILVGKDLIRQAEIRKQITQIEEYKLAYFTFMGKYNCVPGDCVDADEYFTGASSGDGDGLIENNRGYCYDLAPGDVRWDLSIEYQNFFIHLVQSRLIKEQLDPANLGVGYTIGPALPPLVLDPNATFFAGDNSNFECNPGTRNPDTDNYRKGRNALWMVACRKSIAASLGVNTIMNAWDDDGCAPFLGAELKMMDTKMDDGLPYSGMLMGFSGGWAGAGWTAHGCQNAARTDYDVTTPVKQCQSTFVLD
jgi:prepilin-type N-terminal cleavage/methylation domain-containing protein